MGLWRLLVARWQLLIWERLVCSLFVERSLACGAGPGCTFSRVREKVGVRGLFWLLWWFERFFLRCAQMPGVRPGGRPTFLCAQKAGVKKRPCRQRPCASLRATCGARSWAARQNSFRAARSSQTAAASQSTKFGRSTATKRSPCPVLLGAGRRGVDSRSPTACGNRAF